MKTFCTTQCGFNFSTRADGCPDAACAAFKTHLNEKLRAGEVAIFLDGLDEIRERKIFGLLRMALESFLASAAKDVSLIFSTRPYAVAKGFANGLEEMEIAPLGAKQIEAFLTRCFGGHADAVERLRERLKRERTLADLARVPFLLGAMARLFARGGGTATDRLTLYGEIARDLAGRLDKEKGVERFRIDDPDGETKREFLTEFACARLFDAQETDVARRLIFTGEDLKKFAHHYCKARSYLSWVDPKLLAADATATPLLREVGADAYAFAHLTLQEYLAAVGLMRRADAKQTLCKTIFNPTLAAMEVLPMALGLAAKPDEIYAALEALPESLDFANLRVRARGLAYAGDTLAQVRIDALADRFMQFLHGKIAEESPYRNAVMESFSNAVGRSQRALTDRLLAALRDDDWRVRWTAAEALVKLGATTPEIVAFWLAALRDEEGYVGKEAAEALVKLGATTPEIVAFWLASLPYDKNCIVKRAAQTLGLIVEEKSPDVFRKGLRLALTGDDANARRTAARVVGYYDQDEATLRTLENLAANDPNEDIRAIACDAAARYARKLRLFGATPDASGDATAM